jgi:hypothetical protein
MNAPGSYVRWRSPSIAGLAERFVSSDKICLVGRSLIGTAGFSDDSLGQIIKWLQDGKRLNLYLANKLDERPRSEAPLTAYRRLHPYAVEGHLKLFALSDQLSEHWESLPRVFGGTSLRSPVIRQHFASQPLLEKLIAGPADVGIVDEHLQSELAALIESSSCYPGNALQEGEKMAMWELHEGASRALEKIFAPLAGAYVKHIEIRDPYCAAKNNIDRLESFLQFVKDTAQTIESIKMRCRENKDRDGYVEFYLDIDRRIDDLLKKVGYTKYDVEVLPLKRGGKSFHDREVDLVTVDEDGCETTHRYFLTGGIDLLMNQRAETRVFYLRIET